MKEETEAITVGLRLRGSREDIARAVEGFQRLEHLELLPWPPAGGWPVPLATIAGTDLLKQYADRAVRLEHLDGIRGGEVVPHLHLEDEVFLLERSEFKKLVGDIAAKLTAEFAERVGYEGTVDLMGQVAIDTIPLPESPRFG